MKLVSALRKIILPKAVNNAINEKLKERTRKNVIKDHNYYESKDRFDFLRKALIAQKFNGISGDYAEFGCCGANTFCIVHEILANYSYKVGPFHLWAFDSFQGFPQSAGAVDAHPEWIEGKMATSLDKFHKICRSRGVPKSAYTVVPGYYDQTLSAAGSILMAKQIRLAYIDCDMYSSTKAVLKFLIPRLQHGMILAFDDYYCYSSSMPSGERLALAEAFSGIHQWTLVPYIPIGWHGMSFIVESRLGSVPNANHHTYW